MVSLFPQAGASASVRKSTGGQEALLYDFTQELTFSWTALLRHKRVFALKKKTKGEERERNKDVMVND